MSTFETLHNGHNLAGTGCRPLSAQLTFKYVDDNNYTSNHISNNNSIIEEDTAYNSNNDRDSECSFDNDNNNNNNNNNYPYEVVETVLNIQPDNQDDFINTQYQSKMMSRSPSLSESISEGYCTSISDTNNSLSHNDFETELDRTDFNRLYQCVPRTAFHKYPMNQNKNNEDFYDFRRFSEPQIFQKFYNTRSKLSDSTPIIKQNPQEMKAPLRRVASIDGRPQEQLYHTTFNDIDMNLDCPCSKHHHRRNSVAIKFNKALYKKV